MIQIKRELQVSLVKAYETRKSHHRELIKRAEMTDSEHMDGRCREDLLKRLLIDEIGRLSNEKKAILLGYLVQKRRITR